MTAIMECRRAPDDRSRKGLPPSTDDDAANANGRRGRGGQTLSSAW